MSQPKQITSDDDKELMSQLKRTARDDITANIDDKELSRNQDISQGTMSQPTFMARN
jgi:hypothetical protein